MNIPIRPNEIYVSTFFNTLYIMGKTNKVLSFVKNNHTKEHLYSIAYSLSLSSSDKSF
jgi:hypothetical protein